MKQRTWSSVISQRVTRNYLTQRCSAAQLAEVVRAVGGVQAQVLTAAGLAVQARVEALTQPSFEAILWTERQLVKLYSLRGTIHLHPAEDIRIWSAARQAYAGWQGEPWTATYQLTSHQIEQVLKALADALARGPLTRAELAQQVADQVGTWAHARLASSWADLIGLGFDAGLLCFGPNQGSQATFVRLDQWLGSNQGNPDPQSAIQWVIQAFLATYGPATPRDFARWFAAHRVQPATRQQLTTLFAAIGTEVNVEGEQAWSLSTDREVWEAVPDTVRLVPQYDCYLLGSRFGREQVVSKVARQQVATYKNGRFEGAVGRPLLLIAGRVAGMWERQQQQGRLVIRIQPFVALTAKQQRQLADEVERIGNFFQMQAEMRLTPLG